MIHPAELDDVTFDHRRGGGVRNVSLIAAPGEWVTIFGSSGCGKTTLIDLLAGRLQSDAGAVRLFGRPPHTMSRQFGVALIASRIPRLATPLSLLTRAVARRSVPASQRTGRVVEMLELVDLYPVRERPIRELSRGQQTSVAIAAALVARPVLLLLDDLISGLPRPLMDRIHAHIELRRTEDGATVIQATTSSEEAEQSDRVLMLENGRPLALASPEELLAQCQADRVTIEPADPMTVRRTLRGAFDLEVTPDGQGVTISVADAPAAVAQLLRHPPSEERLRLVYVKPSSLWDVFENLRAG